MKRTKLALGKRVNEEMMMQGVLHYIHYGALFFLTTLSFQLLSYREFSDIKKYAVDFDTSMEFTKNDAFESKRLEKKNSQITEFCKKLYNRNNLARVEPLDHVIIPRIVHLIWVGPKTPPPVFKRCLESIKKHLPDWELKLWTDADIPHLKLENQYFYDNETNYGAKSDILRYELLYQFGGVYLDIDFVLLQSLDVLNYTYEFYTSLMPSYTPDVLANGIIASTPGHPIIRHCIAAVKDSRNYEWIIERTGPIHFQKSFYEIARSLNSTRVIAFPKSFFLPIDENQNHLSDVELIPLIKPETFAVHYWADSWSI